MAAPEKVKGPASYFPSIEKNYGHPMDHWFGLVRKQQPSLKHMEIVNWLKAEHGMGHGHAGCILPGCGHKVARRVFEIRGINCS